MGKSLLLDAFAHHLWATNRLIDTCLSLIPEQLETRVPGTYGSILDTLRHLIAGDAWDLYVLNGESAPFVYEDSTDLAKLRTEMESHALSWTMFLDENPDPDAVVREVDPGDGFERDAPLGIRLAAALQHGTEHRTHICTALTTLGVEHPALQVMDFGLENGLTVERWPPRRD